MVTLKNTEGATMAATPGRDVCENELTWQPAATVMGGHEFVRDGDRLAIDSEEGILEVDTSQPLRVYAISPTRGITYDLRLKSGHITLCGPQEATWLVEEWGMGVEVNLGGKLGWNRCVKGDSDALLKAAKLALVLHEKPSANVPGYLVRLDPKAYAQIKAAVAQAEGAS